MSRNTALITGATSGIGKAFAEELAKQNHDLIITGRRAEKIQAVAQEIKEKYSVNVEVVIAELSNAQDLERLIQRIKEKKNLLVLVNNAGFGYKNNFYDGDITIWDNMLKVHVEAVTKLTFAALPNMLANKAGSIVNVSSILAFFPYRKYALYVATKGFMSLFTETLALELKNSGVRVQALCPGLTVTDFHTKMGQDAEKVYKPILSGRVMDPEEVVAASFKYLAKNKVICIPGFINKLIVMLGTLIRFLIG
jgi:uncharacterized protein